MKSIKMMGLTTVLSTLIQKLRIDELNSAMGYRWLVVLTNMVGELPTRKRKIGQDSDGS